jgi:hypothetical protein
MKALFISAMMFIALQSKAQSEGFVSIEKLNDNAARALFLELQDEGTIVYEGEDDDTGMAIYTLYFDECVIEYAYEPEILEFIKTGKFEYNDFLIENYQVIETPQQ